MKINFNGECILENNGVDGPQITTERLNLMGLQMADGDFISELVNSQGWLEYIGDRHVKTLEDAKRYINGLLENPNIDYWVVRLNNTLKPIGVITKIQRETMTKPDIGFAFLPEFQGQGYAYEATLAVLCELDALYDNPKYMAMTLPHNQPSINLLKRLDFKYMGEIEDHGETLALFERI